MGNDKEEFTRIHIEKTDDIGWHKPVPVLNYWSFMLSRKVMSTEQSEFYKYMSAMLDKGVAVDLHGQFGYVSLLKDELLRQFHSRLHADKASIIDKAKKLVRLYNYKGNDLNPVLAMEIVQNRKNRLKAVKNEAFAQWIAPGQEIEIAGKKLIRGAFYLGTHLGVATFNSKSGVFNRLVENIEGPIIDPKYINANTNDYHIPQPSTFAEQSSALRQDFIAWLAGEGAISSEILAYYLAGIEFFLLFDKRPTKDDRLQVLRHLKMLLDDSEIPFVIRNEFKERISALIDLSLSRYFIDDIDTAAIELDPVKHPLFVYSKYCQWIVKNISRTDSAADKAKKLTEILPVPKDLPQEFTKDYKQYFQKQIQAEINSRHIPWIDTDKYRYVPMNMQGVYFPTDIIRTSLKESEMHTSESTRTLFYKFKYTWSRLLSSIAKFLQLLSIEASPLALHAQMPSWIDPNKLPGVSEALAKISPDDGSAYKMVYIRDLMEAFGISYFQSDYVDKGDFGVLQMRLHQLGLRVGASNTVIRIRQNDMVPVLHNTSADIPRRGTLPISLYLICWLLGAESPTKRDLEIVDQWLEQYDPKSDWAQSAQGIVRWLSSRKLTLNAKRKLKAAKLANYAKRRDELQRLLLQLVSDPEGTSPKRMKRLEAIYETIGLDPTQIHSDIHRLATGAAKAPKAAKTASKAAASVLDRNLLRQMEQSTASAKKMLAQVFQEPSEAEESSVKDAAKKTKKQDPLIEILKAVAQRDSWTRSEFEALAKKHGLTAGAALEKINDKAYDLLDESIAEDDGEEITVDTALANSLIAAL